MALNDDLQLRFALQVISLYAIEKDNNNNNNLLLHIISRSPYDDPRYESLRHTNTIQRIQYKRYNTKDTIVQTTLRTPY